MRLVGPDALSFRERLVLLTAKIIREDYLYQDSFNPDDAYTSLEKQYHMLKTISTLFNTSLEALGDREEFDFTKLEELPVIQKVARMKELKNEEIDKFKALQREVATEVSGL